MDHSSIRDKLSDYIDDAVTPQERSVLDAHLSGCSECRDALHELKRTIEQVKQLEEVDPPAWMTTKIMATVREEAARKRSVFQRVLDSFIILRPVSIIAVLFLTITAYYLYNANIPVDQPYETPMASPAKHKPSVAAGGTVRTESVHDKTTSRSKEISHAPGYQSLDMKMEYEKPQPPALKDEAAPPTPGPPTEQARQRSADSTGLPAAPPHSQAPAIMQERLIGAGVSAASAPQAAAGKRAAAVASQAGPGQQFGFMISVKDMDSAAREVERAVKDVEGEIIAADQTDKARVYTVRIGSRRMGDLTDRLKRIGKMEKPLTDAGAGEYRTEIRIELVKNSPE